MCIKKFIYQELIVGVAMVNEEKLKTLICKDQVTIPPNKKEENYFFEDENKRFKKKRRSLKFYGSPNDVVEKLTKEEAIDVKGGGFPPIKIPINIGNGCDC